ncbi:hypothetical protein ACUY26_06475 [Corynebacterium segmentosum]
MSYSIPLDLRQIMNCCPVDRNLKPADGVNREVTFTFAPHIVASPSAPAYSNPSYLATWLLGYWAGQEEADNKQEGDK